ncbi:hypothetical protein Bpfe_021388 [Biomphalaria pfeifferi]|uniref:Uncharacterized protein n=1 Tax=Biomphalaria pfeifferi TaxID=112525 RepID=A0AAD8F2W6_BIOPF|nr:hypothetical protein Bpfe_021388 [Biomphalaria pfeifferi]
MWSGQSVITDLLSLSAVELPEGYSPFGQDMKDKLAKTYCGLQERLLYSTRKERDSDGRGETEGKERTKF